jgi:nitrite reductase/ring-hydroxylating ferredoxin subunit
VSQALELWAAVADVQHLKAGGTLFITVLGEPVLFCKLAAHYYAYRATCPGCGQSLERATLQKAELACQECGRRYDLHREGQSVDAPQRQLESIPLLIPDHGVKVAVEARRVTA